MNRKLHNTLTAALACSILLTAALMASVPAPPNVQALQGMAAMQADAAGDFTAASSDLRPAARHAYQSVRMPFFSFFLPRS